MTGAMEVEPVARPRPGLPRWFDLLAAAVGLVVCSPLLVVVAAAVRLSSPGPVLFRQVRLGRGGRPFVMYKFRTMVADANGMQVTAAGDPRVTRVGRWLRLLKLDELPELFNVVRGDMALVGPRPEVPRYVDLEDPRWKKVLAVRPGITDPVTILLRDEEKLLAAQGADPEVFYRQVLQPAKLEGYLQYLQRRNWWRDLLAVLQTVWVVGARPRWLRRGGRVGAGLPLDSSEPTDD